MMLQTGFPQDPEKSVHPEGCPSSFRAIGSILATSVAAGITLPILVLSRIALEIFGRAHSLLQRLFASGQATRRPFLICLSASIAGSFIVIADGAFAVSVLGHLFRTIGATICALLLTAAAPMVFDEICDPDRAPTGWLGRSIRGFYQRGGRREVDGAWLEVLLAVSLLVMPPFAALLATSNLQIDAALFYGATIWAVRKPTVDLEHGDSHYAFFKTGRNARPLDRIVFPLIDWFYKYPFALLTTRIPHWYAVQHVAVHHAENNGLADTQSTASYDRASFTGFAICAQQFALSGLLPVDVVRYLIARRRMKPLRRLFVGYAVYAGFISSLFIYSPSCAILVIAIRYLSLIGDAASFFQEHGLVDPDNPDEIVTNSLHYVADNDHGSRGEDHHVEHHLKPGTHWSLYPARMTVNLPDYERLRAMAFVDGPGQLRNYYRCLWLGDFAELAKHVRVIGGEGMTSEQVQHLLKERTAPVTTQRRVAAPLWLERICATVASRII